MTALQPAFAKISAKGVRYSALPGHTTEIAEALNDELSAKWRELRGIEIASFGINAVNASREDEEMIKELQRRAVMRDPTMAAATIVGAQADAMTIAAGNEAGAMMGFMGMGMAYNAGGANAGGLYAMGQNNNPTPQNPTPSTQNGWTCACGATNTGNFCAECGTKKPETNGWTCSCGSVNKGKFCSNCGAKKPAGVPLYKCDKCGWEPSDPKNPPRFCPECGDPFNDDDIK